MECHCTDPHHGGKLWKCTTDECEIRKYAHRINTELRTYDAHLKDKVEEHPHTTS